MTSWTAAWEILRWLLPLVGLAVGWWVRDRRKDRAAADVAEKTVPAEVGMKDTGYAEARLVYIQREMDAERQFHRDQISDRDAEIERQRAELAHRDELIARLRVEAEDLRDRLADATRQVASVMARLDELTEHDQLHGGAPSPRISRELR